MKSVDDRDIITEQDRALWQAYIRRARETAPVGAGGDRGISDEDVGLLASYLENRLDEIGTAEFERRLVDEPKLLDAVIAASAAAHGPSVEPAAVPQSLIAFAINFSASGRSAQGKGAARLAGKAERRPWLFASPAFAWSIATVAVLSFSAIGVYVAVDYDGGSAGIETSDGKNSIVDDLDRRNESVFTDPAKIYFDGTEVDD